MRLWLLSLAIVYSSVFGNSSWSKQQARSFSEFPRQRIDLERCSFELPMQDEFQVRVSRSGTPPYANFYGQFITSEKSRVRLTHMELACYDTSHPNVLRAYCINPDGSRRTQGECKEGSLRTKPITITGPNWLGIGNAIEYSAVPEEERGSFLMICLIKERTALCIRSGPLQYEIRPAENAWPFVLDYIRNITFVDPVTAPAAQTATSSPTGSGSAANP